MNKRLLTVLGFALVVSGVASFIVYRLVSAQMTANANKPSNKLVVAARNLEIGALLKDTDLKLADWAATPPPGSFTKMEDVVGRGVVQTMYQEEPILETRIAAKGAGAGLAATIPQGMRAVAVRVNDVVGVAGFVTPGMRVDILIAGTPPGVNTANTGTLSKTLLQNIEVLSAGTNIQKDAEGKPIPVPVVNLLVTPEQAEILSLASNETRIQLVLRNPTDKEVSKTSGTAVSLLFADGNKALPARTEAPRAPRRASVPRPEPVPVAAKPAEAPKPIPILVEVIHGTQRNQAKFEEKANDKKQPEGNNE